MLKIRVLAISAGITSLLAASAYAHGGGKPEHGGVLQMVGETSLELVVRPDHVELYVEDEGEEVPSAGHAAKLTVTQDGKSIEKMLQPAGGNKFEGADIRIAKGAKAAVLVTDTATQSQVGTTFTIN
jgi:hypothetical protein